ncbi:MAG: hypothetical protein GXO56_01255 [Chloroflexi bacterium]|nr:hypothetical protein [Chloroflexota bacterium]
MTTQTTCTPARWPRWGWAGLALIAIAWPINWFWPGLRTHIAFFPLWLGYALTVDALTYRRCGHSLLSRSPKRYAMLFVISAPAWWLFEALNLRTQNWHYLGREHFSNLTYGVLATLSFSTVMPAVFGTAQLVRTFAPFNRPLRGPVVRPTRKTLITAFLAGWLMLAFMLAFPRYGFPFLWLSLYFLLEPLNAWLGRRTLLEWTRNGDWQPIYTLWVGVLITAFFWEMWNYFSYPKWVYTVPFVGFWHIFEMPLLGYGGYLPFALELFALYHFVIGLFGHPRDTYLTDAVAASQPQAD